MFLKVGNEGESFKSSAREFHSPMDDGIQYFCNTSSILRNSYISIISQNGNQKLHLLREGPNLACMRVMSVFIHYT